MAKNTTFWYGVTVNYETVQYFSICQGLDKNGVFKFKIYVLDPDGIVYDFNFKGYAFQIEERVISFIENGGK